MHELADDEKRGERMCEAVLMRAAAGRGMPLMLQRQLLLMLWLLFAVAVKSSC
jgi:hypothetical protein